MYNGLFKASKDDYLDLCRLVNGFDIITFDIHNTALVRNVLSPTDIFELVDRKLESIGIKINDFKVLRIKAEEIAKQQAQTKGIHIDEIYQILANNIGEDISRKIKGIELSLEREFTSCNLIIKKVYDYAIAQGKTVSFTSNGTLPKGFVVELLVKNGFSCFTEIYVARGMETSYEGFNLFQQIRNNMGEDRSLLYVGDHFETDYEQALEYRVSIFHYSIRWLNANHTLSLEKSIMKAIQYNFCETTEELGYWECFGIQLVSSLFFGFSLWIANLLRGKENVYFLSRIWELTFSNL